MAKHIFKRKGIFYYRRRVPEYIQDYDDRTSIKASLGTRDEKEAIRKAAIYNDYIEEYWRSLIKNSALDAEAEYKLAKAHGFAYKSITEIVKAPIEDVVERLSIASKTIESPETVSSVLGVSEPTGMPFKSMHR